MTRMRGPARERGSRVPSVMDESSALRPGRPQGGPAGRGGPAIARGVRPPGWRRGRGRSRAPWKPASRLSHPVTAHALLRLGADRLELRLLLGAEGGAELLARIVQDRLDPGRDLVVDLLQTEPRPVDDLLRGLALPCAQIQPACQ